MCSAKSSHFCASLSGRFWRVLSLYRYNESAARKILYTVEQERFNAVVATFILVICSRSSNSRTSLVVSSVYLDLPLPPSVGWSSTLSKRCFPPEDIGAMRGISAHSLSNPSLSCSRATIEMILRKNPSLLLWRENWFCWPHFTLLSGKADGSNLGLYSQ